MLGYSRRKIQGDISEREILCISDCLAKTWRQPDGEVLPGRDVYTHCLIVSQIAQAIIDHLPKKLVNRFFSEGMSLVAGGHDIGKVSPTFQHKIYKNLTKTPQEIWDKLKDADEDESLWGGHAGVSQSTLEYLQEGDFIANIVGQHHGFSTDIGIYPADARVFGGKRWLKERVMLLEELKKYLKSEFPVVQDPLQAKLIAGLTTVSDWIGSGSLFDDPSEDWQPKINQALDLAGFVSPRLKRGLTFEEVFGFQPRDVQRKLIQITTKPGVYILEAPMGLGKTEAALYSAYRLLEEEQARGIYFALPTQLTSNKIHERMRAFLEQILEKDSSHNNPILLHSQAWLKYYQMGEEGVPGKSWFSQGKRGILAPFAVGTIDQALMAVLHVKHGFVRTFGLAGKVVILDEVHTYDAYTGTIMDLLIDALRKLGCVVIILSATLTKKRRQKLLNCEVYKFNYPLITCVDSDNKNLKEEEALISKVQQVHVKTVAETYSALEEALERSENGEQVLWIENTVAEAQEIYLTLSARAQCLDVEVGLLHSRFTHEDRQSYENYWVERYGKEGWKERSSFGRILVGTQVLEQSLDIDADFLVTRLAPTDMLLQRIGRLWRHDNPDRCSSAKPEVWIIAPQLSQAIANADEYLGKSAKIYMPYVLCRTIEVWQNINQILLPNDMRRLIEDTYSKREDSKRMFRYYYELEQQRRKLQALASEGLSDVGRGKPDEVVSTRYSEQDNVEILLLKTVSLNQKHSGQIGTWIVLLNDEKLFLPHNGKILSPSARRELAAKLSMNMVRVVDYVAPDKQTPKTLAWLKDYAYLGHPDQRDSNVRVGVVRGDGSLVDINGNLTVNEQYIVSYSLDLGYRIKKRV